MRVYFSRIEQIMLVGLLLAIIGGMCMLSYATGRKQREQANLPFIEQAAPAAAATPAPAPAATTPPAEEIVVHVTGAVKRPGVYRFAEGARIDDAVLQAGGARADSYPDALNLAARLEDGAHITVPTKTEWQRLSAQPAPPPLVSTAPSNPAQAPLVTKNVTPSYPNASTPAPNASTPGPAGKVRLNTATAQQLETLPGIGPVTAQLILDYRQQHGAFTDLAQLLDIKGIGPKSFEKIEPHLTL